MKYYDCEQCGKRTANVWRRETARFCSVYCRTRVFVKEYSIPRPIVEKFSGETRMIEGSILVNAEYYEWLNQYKWHISDTGYAVRRVKVGGKTHTVRMHRLIVEPADDEVVDHINHNTVDNRVTNLRPCTQQSNARNRLYPTKGYCWDRAKGKWLVRYNDTYYGRYKTEDEAKQAYKRARGGVPYPGRPHRVKYHLPMGVFKNRSNSGYQSKVQIQGERIYLGTFSTVAEAEQAYIMAKKERIAS